MSDQEELQLRRQRLARLRRIGVKRGAHDLTRPPEPPPVPEMPALPGEPVDTPFGPAWVRTARFSLSERPEFGELAAAEPEALAAAGRDQRLAGLEPERAAFIDTETTGLALGAGTYTFLIGVGTYEEPGEFVVRQFFMRNPGEERAQLHLVEECLSNCTGIVSFNGRAFDLPLIQSRFILARMPFPLASAPHLDLLPPARRVWRARYGSCTLGSLERNVLGLRRTDEDVPGWMIPDIYRDYYRTGVAGDLLGRVFYHNLEDITSMTVLAARLVALFPPGGAVNAGMRLHPLEWLSLARCYRDLAWEEAGIAAYRVALDGPLQDAERIRVLRDLGHLYKQLGRRAEAVTVWEEWIGTIAGDDLTPYVELAKHHEWITGDLPAARGWSAWALRIAESRPDDGYPENVAQLKHRLARLERKLIGISAPDDEVE